MKTSFPKDKLRVVLLENPHAAADRVLSDADYTSVTRVPGALAGADLLDAVGEAHVLGIRSKTRITEEVLEAAGRLLAVGCFCIGTNQVDLGAARRRGVPVFNSPFSNTRSVAEVTIAEVVVLHRRLFDKSRQMHEGLWDKSASGAHEVRGRTLGIVGYGHIGSQVSILAEALGMRVLFHDVAPRLALGNARPAGSLDELLAASDVVTLHVPATRQTEKLIGERELRQIKPGAMLINNARGSVVDLAALADALRDGRVAGAALDVFPEEPAGKSDGFGTPLSGLGNVVLTPHIGGSTLEAQAGIAADVAGKLVRFLDNGSTTGAVNVPEVDLPELVRTADLGAARHAHRVLHFHRNVPGVLSTMHQLIAGLGANVSAEYLQTDPEVGYVVLDVDPTDSGAIVDGLRGIPETIRVRALW